MDFIAEQLKDKVVIEQPAQLEEEVIAEQQVDASSEAPVETQEQTKQEEKVEEQTPAQLEKLKIDYNEWLQQNEDTLYKYLSEKKTDYNSLKEEEVVAKKLQQEYPNLSKEEIDAELFDKYGIGDSKIEITDDMDIDEVKEAKKHNKEYDAKLRNLKKDAPAYLNELNSKKEAVTLPDFEYEIPVVNKQLSDEEYQEQLVQNAEKIREEVWIPELRKAMSEIPSVKKSVTFEYNGENYTVDVDYKLSEKEKQDYLNELSFYTVSQKDQEKYQDVQGFVQDKIQSLVVDKLLSTSAKEVAAIVTKNFVKETLVNFDDSGKRQPQAPDSTSDFAQSFFQKNSQRNRNL
jgi:hypothetical protein